MRKASLKIALIFAFCVLFFRDSYSLTVLQAQEGKTLQAPISDTRLNQVILPAEGAQVITSSKNIDLKINGKNLFIKLIEKRERPEPIDLFIMLKDKTYSLTLMPEDIPQQIIVINDPYLAAKQRAAVWERSHDYVTTLVELIKYMAANQLPQGYRLEEERLTYGVKLPQGEVTLEEVRAYSGMYLKGIVFSVKNYTGKEICLSENQFYRPGILAVSIQKQRLSPGETTILYLVERNTDVD